MVRVPLRVRIHLDYVGPFMNKMFLRSYYSKWLKVLPVNNATTPATIEQLLKVFSSISTHGLPNTIVLYNGLVFTRYYIY